jgi:acetoin utilization protein AcuB
MSERCAQCGGPVSRPKTVGDVMTRDPFILGPEDTLAAAMEAMRRHHIRRAPVVAGDRLVGLVAEGDLKRAQPSVLDATPEEFQRVMEGTPVARIMISNPVTVGPDTPLADAVRTLHTTKFGALPVLKDDRLVGILTDSDLIRTLADVLA